MISISVSALSLGSSPRVRGTPELPFLPHAFPPVHPRVCGELAGGCDERRTGGRFIPACAGNSDAATPWLDSCTVHPRVCGELGWCNSRSARAGGSSPRVRGTRRRGGGRLGALRFIPACAGNSSPVNTCAVLVVGSSPRVRGTRRAPVRGAADGRFIPACAGNSAGRTRSPCRFPVHPRVCGELMKQCTIVLSKFGSSPRVRGTRGPFPSARGPPPGSSPRVRGTLQRERPFLEGLRFIPACAGNSRRAPPPPARSAVHPRVCGELARFAVIVSNRVGSSPRVRGTLRRRNARSERRSVHPRVCGELMQAGQTAVGTGGSSPRVRGTRRGRRSGRRPRPVHPRVCGELSLRMDGAAVVFGSSPRVRGTPLTPKIADVRNRFIPACAGNSSRPPPRTGWPPVHPRVCGELLRIHAGNVAADGSSPRVRGTLCNGVSPGELRRFIPACAGNSRTAAAGSLASPVHPRVCGELNGTEREERHGERFIPACAGNSMSSGW